jgi:septum formation protein
VKPSGEHHGRRPRLVLASSSPRRSELLSGLGVEFARRPVKVDESPLPDELPADYVDRVARDKALAAAAGAGEVVIAADTIVALHGQLLGKPESADAARSMLRALAGRQHSVYTAVAVSAPPQALVAAVACSHVRFSELTDSEIDWYVGTLEPLDKAGAYAVQGLGALFVESIDGNYSNVVGLPLPLLYRLLRSVGHDLRSLRPAERDGLSFQT